jgi:murein DD-endopeptidase MepM/ murein hydrolase activator NlpD
LAALLCCCFLVAAATSIAATGGSGGVVVAPAAPPQLLEGRCADMPQHPCMDRRLVEPGGSVVLRGRRLSDVTAVVFYGQRGPSDDVSSPVTAPQASSVRTTVPPNVHDGPLAVQTSTGKRSRRWTGLMIEEAEAPLAPQPPGPGPSIGTAVSTPSKVFYGGLKKPVFAYQVGGGHALDVNVNIVRVSDGAVVRTWSDAQSAPGVAHKIIWDGTVGGRVQPQGQYAFRVGSPGAVASSSSPQNGTFAFYDHMFPVRGKHEFGDGAARFGAGRTGHSHQGQDVFASCGTPLVAARAGKVLYKGYHALAGYYLVIAGSGTGQDYLYAHLRQPALVSKGERVYTGQPIGEVGETGNAVGCHLHFEIWSGPGWYKGGHPIDPLSELMRWDHFS